MNKNRSCLCQLNKSNKRQGNQQITRTVLWYSMLRFSLSPSSLFILREDHGHQKRFQAILLFLLSTRKVSMGLKPLFFGKTAREWLILWPPGISDSVKPFTADKLLSSKLLQILLRISRIPIKRWMFFLEKSFRDMNLKVLNHFNKLRTWLLCPVLMFPISKKVKNNFQELQMNTMRGISSQRWGQWPIICNWWPWIRTIKVLSGFNAIDCFSNGLLDLDSLWPNSQIIDFLTLFYIFFNFCFDDFNNIWLLKIR